MRWKFALLILLQIVLLAGIIGYRQYWITTNERIILESVPVDPSDVFRGDYVTLSYDISRIDLDRIKATQDFKRNDTIYAIMKKTDDGTYKVDAVSKVKPAQGKFIRGRVIHAYDKSSRKKITIQIDDGSFRVFEQPWFAYKQGEYVLLCLGADGRINSAYKSSESVKCREGEESLTGIVTAVETITFRQVNAQYGIEHYFVEEGKGRIIENARRASDLKVEVALRPDGKGLITALHLNGKRFE